tara:strand:- start:281 stop:841 length:561 start_codon:yes stop_codon:yes gene_type:complete
MIRYPNNKCSYKIPSGYSIYLPDDKDETYTSLSKDIFGNGIVDDTPGIQTVFVKKDDNEIVAMGSYLIGGSITEDEMFTEQIISIYSATNKTLPKGGLLKQLGVKEGHRRKGIGTFLTAYRLSILYNASAQLIFAHILNDVPSKYSNSFASYINLCNFGFVPLVTNQNIKHILEHTNHVQNWKQNS